jgi:DNA polymerase
MSEANALQQLRQILETEKAFGLREMPAPTSAKPLKVAYTGSKVEALKTLQDEFADCRICGLCETRTKLVFGAGNPNADLMFIGEAPGYDEDQQGMPFVGAAGQLLTKIIEAMKLKREAVYIANCLKCRPPGNRNPLPTEIISCKPILTRQVEIIQPKIICALGKFAAQTLLDSTEPITRLRGRFFDWNGIKLMPTFHPAYLLRNPGDKKLVWQDMQIIMKELGIS